jgi:hypothetical protein
MGNLASAEKNRIKDITQSIMDRIVANCNNEQVSDLYKLSKRLRDDIDKVTQPQDHPTEMDKAVRKLDQMAFNKYAVCCVDTWMVGFNPCDPWNTPWALDALHASYASAIAPYISDSLPWFLGWVSVNNIISLLEVVGVGVLLYLSIDALYAAVIAALIGGTIIVAAAATTSGTTAPKVITSTYLATLTPLQQAQIIAHALDHLNVNFGPGSKVLADLVNNRFASRDASVALAVQATGSSYITSFDANSKVTVEISGPKVSQVIADHPQAATAAPKGAVATAAAAISSATGYVINTLPDHSLLTAIPTNTQFVVSSNNTSDITMTHDGLEAASSEILALLATKNANLAAYLATHPTPDPTSTEISTARSAYLALHPTVSFGDATTIVTASLTAAATAKNYAEAKAQLDKQEAAGTNASVVDVQAIIAKHAL